MEREILKVQSRKDCIRGAVQRGTSEIVEEDPILGRDIVVFDILEEAASSTDETDHLSYATMFDTSLRQKQNHKRNSLQSHNKPNILIILADDVGTSDIPYWGDNIVPMENIQKLQSSVSRSYFMDAHASLLCAPSRYMLLSDNYPHRGYQNSGVWNFSKTSSFTIRKALQKYSRINLIIILTISISGRKALMLQSVNNNDDSIIDEAGEGDPSWDSTEYNTKLVKEVNNFLERHDTPDPFFLYVGLGPVHMPHSPVKFYLDGTPVAETFSDPHLDMLYELDLVIGSMISSVEERGLMENTLVIFASKNDDRTHLWWTYNTYDNEI